MTLNTYIAGDVASGHAMGDYMRREATNAEDRANRWRDGIAKVEWDGPAFEAFAANRAEPEQRDGHKLADINQAMAAPFRDWSGSITAAKDWMERAKQVALDGELTVRTHAILAPQRFTATPPAPWKGDISASEAAAAEPAVSEFEASKALHAKQEAAFAEAQGMVQQARKLEREAHDDLRNALTARTEEIKELGRYKDWSQAGKAATTPAATALMGLATDFETQSVQAGRAAFEKAVAQGPHATNSMWMAMSGEQRADLVSR